MAKSFDEFASEQGIPVDEPGRPVVCVQGLGFVGAAMAIAVARASDNRGEPLFHVIGIDLPTPQGRERVDALNSGRFPFATTDPALNDALQTTRHRRNLIATVDECAYELANVTVVDVPLDVVTTDGTPGVDWSGFKAAIRTLGRSMPAGSLVIVETTVPPGTCEKVVTPELREQLAQRGLPDDAIRLAHSYERVTPGPNYLNSIINYWRVFSGATPAAAVACGEFLSQVINVEDFPLTELPSMAASETAKVLENSYRAASIAFIDEWGRFAEAIGIDLFKVIDAVRLRPTHANLRQPGFGVGGYCLVKDPEFPEIAARTLYNRPDLTFPVSRKAVLINAQMPLVTLDLVQEHLGGSLTGKQILLAGIAYRDGVDDTRNSPSELFARSAAERGACLSYHDPLVRQWPELDVAISSTLPSPGDFDAVVFAVSHAEYQKIDFCEWLDQARPLVVDANNVLKNTQRDSCQSLGCHVISIGRGVA